MAFVTETYRPKLSLRDRAAEMIKSYRERAEQRRIFRQTVSELQGLSARELSDIGIHYSMIESIAHESAYGTN